ncbi:MAG: O-antigen ligase family protein [Nitrosomonas sp.]|nr:MAG: O-antigen ligase family protein [Nitrosomonas sp.]
MVEAIGAGVQTAAAGMVRHGGLTPRFMPTGYPCKPLRNAPDARQQQAEHGRLSKIDACAPAPVFGPAKREWLVRLVLLLVCAGFWHSGLNAFSFPLLVVVCIMDGGLYRLHQVVRLPLVQALLALCILLLLGLTWSEAPLDGRMKWLKYFVLLIFIPFYVLLNRQRLPWALGGLLTGYAVVLGLGIYQWLMHDEQGIALLGMSYLSFSAMLGAGVVTFVGLACISRMALQRTLFGVLAAALLLVQFHQHGRVLLLAALAAVLLIVCLRYRAELNKLLMLVLALVAVSTLFAWNSSAFQARWQQMNHDIALLQQGNYGSSLGYRLAMWDVGVHAILERPWTGYGTGMAADYFDRAIETYKNGRYRNLPAFQQTSHFHNDWIEIGMHVGVPGMLALGFVLWGWFQALRRNRLMLLGSGLVGFLLLAGLTDTFLLFSRTPVLLLLITAIAMHWQECAATTDDTR